MNGVTPEVRQVPAPGDVAPPSDPSLVEQAEGLGRAAVMKSVLGPHLDALMRPIYDSDISPTESATLGSLAGDFPTRTLDGFSLEAIWMADSRFRTSVKDGSEYERFIGLNDSREDLLYFHDRHARLFKEAIDTSINVPVTIAAHISKLEGDMNRSVGYRLLRVDKLTEIMERRSFDRILAHLTKGPNEFLGESSDKFYPNASTFFSFERNKGSLLRIRDAYTLRDGKVTGLSAEYHVAAEKRRRILRSLGSTGGHRGSDSSGCPVRHSFEDAAGEPQEPLIFTAKKFVIAAMRRAEQIPL